MSSAHIFYIPVIFVVGLLAGYFMGRNAAEAERAEQRKRLKRRKALQKKKQEKAESEDAA